ncbi:MAG: retroviral-like aspartic protease family protein [Tannerella sp.]|jgi:predicted aspartyl protease|nr:retroviral-like aspartic protease family protein [Tannerella sp.]
MRLKFIVLLFFVCAITGVKAQGVDEYMSGLLEDADWFELEEVYFRKKAEMQSDMLKQLTEAMLHAHFNQPEAAINSLDTLLSYHQNELGFNSVSDLIALKSRLYAEQGLYQDASDNCAHFLNQLAAFNVSKDSFPTHLFIQRHYDEIAYIPKPGIIRPDRDVEIPLEIKNSGLGNLMYIPVTVHGKEYHFMFDTGIDFTYLSDRMAKEMNIHISYESDEIKGIGKEVGKIGAIDSMQIGDMKIKDVLVMVGTSAIEGNEAFQVDAILGLDFFRLVGEIQFFPKEGKVVFPINRTKRPKSGRNLMIDHNRLYLKAYSGKERLIFQMNTSDLSSGLYYPYYMKHEKLIESKGTKESMNVYRLPQLPLKIGKKKLKLKHVPVSTEKMATIHQNGDGALGMDFITQFKKVVINFDQMFVEVK